MNSLGYINNSSYNVEMINKQCNAGGPLETPGGLYRGMLIYVNSIKKDVQAVRSMDGWLLAVSGVRLWWSET